mmetsp:Transcript_129302/g.360117  ORF Transcript_129302/g.360117 Transcript_129302/m.360117 type:complete len:208 (+) Transcript_129302:1601-2224(+)
MHNALLVQVVQCAGNPDEDANGLALWDPAPPLELLEKRPLACILKQEVDVAFVLKVLEQANDVRMVNQELCPDLSVKVARHVVFHYLALRDDLHREDLFGPLMHNLPHSAEGPRADVCTHTNKVAERVFGGGGPARRDWGHCLERVGGCAACTGRVRRRARRGAPRRDRGPRNLRRSVCQHGLRLVRDRLTSEISRLSNRSPTKRYW